LLVVWTFVVRHFPRVLGDIILKKFDARNATALERLKAELARDTQAALESLRADYTTIKATTDFLATNQSVFRRRVISSTELLWTNINAIQKELGHIVFIESVALPKELQTAFAEGKWPTLMEPLRRYKSVDDAVGRFMSLEGDDLSKARLFVGDRLWLIYYTFKAVYIRTVMLLVTSSLEHRYISWRDDAVIRQHLIREFGEDAARSFFESGQPTFQLVVGKLEAKFLKEAMRVMSGSSALADTFSDVSAVLAYEKARISVGRVPSDDVAAAEQAAREARSS